MTIKGKIMLGDTLDLIMKEKKITNKAMSEMLDNQYNYSISKESIAKYRNNSRTPEPTLIKYFSDILNVSTDFLLGVDKKPVSSVPVLGTASCGGKAMTYKKIGIGRTASYSGKNYNSSLYCMIACGDAMSPEIENCDEVICDPSEAPESGDMVHYRIGGENAIKVLWIDTDANIIQLIPYSPSEDFKVTTIRMDDEIYSDLTLSKVVAVNKLTYNNRSSRLKLIGRT